MAWGARTRPWSGWSATSGLLVERVDHPRPSLAWCCETRPMNARRMGGRSARRPTSRWNDFGGLTRAPGQIGGAIHQCRQLLRCPGAQVAVGHQLRDVRPNRTGSSSTRAHLVGAPWWAGKKGAPAGAQHRRARWPAGAEHEDGCPGSSETDGARALHRRASRRRTISTWANVLRPHPPAHNRPMPAPRTAFGQREAPPRGGWATTIGEYLQRSFRHQHAFFQEIMFVRRSRWVVCVVDSVAPPRSGRSQRPLEGIRSRPAPSGGSLRVQASCAPLGPLAGFAKISLANQVLGGGWPPGNGCVGRGAIENPNPPQSGPDQTSKPWRAGSSNFLRGAPRTVAGLRRFFARHRNSAAPACRLVAGPRPRTAVRRRGSSVRLVWRDFSRSTVDFPRKRGPPPAMLGSGPTRAALSSSSRPCASRPPSHAAGRRCAPMGLKWDASPSGRFRVSPR